MMGRPPIGDRAMTDAERQRRHRGKGLYRDAASVTKPADSAGNIVTAPDPEDWDVAAALKVWFEKASEEDREEFASSLSDIDVHAFLYDYSGCGGAAAFVEWLYREGCFEGTDYVKLPPGVNRNELDGWLRSKYGKGLDEDDPGAVS